MKPITHIIPFVAFCTAMPLAPVMAQQGPIPLLPAPAAIPAHNDHNETVFLRTTTETLEYCKHLSGRVDDLLRGDKSGGNDKVRFLSQEGERLCETGQTRSGILHLRRAFVILRQPDGEQ